MKHRQHTGPAQLNEADVRSPFLHFAVRLAGVINQSADVSHPVSVNDHSAVQIQAVVVPLVRILHRHSSPELLLTDDLTQILCDELT